jgi:glycosyltransferase involved in cell wall biosynthesis
VLLLLYISASFWPSLLLLAQRTLFLKLNRLMVKKTSAFRPGARYVQQGSNSFSWHLNPNLIGPKMSSFDKPVILTFVGNYLPGYKAGGILRSIVNMVDHLCNEFEFRVVTRDRDLGEAEPYPDIQHNQWKSVGNAFVYYIHPERITVKNLRDLVQITPHQVLYLNSFLDPLTVKILLSCRFGLLNSKKIIVAPRGEFAWGSLRLKYPKKFFYIKLARLFRLYQNVTWQASSEFEASDIVKVMGIKADRIHIAPDLPNKVLPEEDDVRGFQTSLDCGGLKIVFLSRIAREKNLDYALRIIKKVRARVFFDIYGPAEDAAYWEDCRNLIKQLPDHVTVKYLGSVNPNDVIRTFSGYDLFLFPTAGENYGHVIAEALTSGTPVLISTETPWRNLQKDGLGWDMDLDDMDSFVGAIEDFALMSDSERLVNRVNIRAKIMDRLLDTGVLKANRHLFNSGE